MIILIMYRHQNYNITMNIWLPCNYTEDQPFCYIIPRGRWSSQICPMSTNLSWFSWLPFSEWNHNDTNVVTILHIPETTFSETCSIFTKAKPGRKESKEFESVWDNYCPNEETNMLNIFSSQHLLRSEKQSLAMNTVGQWLRCSTATTTS